MILALRHLLGWMISAFRFREDLILENLALHQQLLALHAQRPRDRLTALHKLFWVALRTFWSEWRKPLVLVTPRTVVNWHRAGFRLYWAWVSRVKHVGGRKRVSKEVRALIFRMVAENPTWGAPHIHGELLKLGFDVSERSVSRWMRRAPKDPDPLKRWLMVGKPTAAHRTSGPSPRASAHRGRGKRTRAEQPIHAEKHSSRMDPV
jgi:putative transposase